MNLKQTNNTFWKSQYFICAEAVLSDILMLHLLRKKCKGCTNDEKRVNAAV